MGTIDKKNRNDILGGCQEVAAVSFRWIFVLAFVVGMSAARAGEVTIEYKALDSTPPNETLHYPTSTSPNPKVTKCVDGYSAPSPISVTSGTPPTTQTYVFAFWDLNGTLSFDETQNICSGETNTTASAWYLLSGGGPPQCPPPGCYVTTFAFSLDHPRNINTTPIESVTPNTTPPAWTPPSSVVYTYQTAETITAKANIALGGKLGSEPFRFWKQIPPPSPPTPPGSTYTASLNSTAYVGAFYGPDPCQSLRNQLAALNPADFPTEAAYKAAAEALAKELRLCEEKWGEIAVP
jgi:hypothetical protein